MLYTDIKEIIITYKPESDFYLLLGYYIDQIRFGENYIYENRKCCGFDKDYDFEWKFETKNDVYNYKNDFLEICKLAIEIKPARIFKTCSGFYTIQIVFKDGTVKEYSYTLSFEEHGMKELRDAILKALPANCKVYPSCIR